MNEKKISSHKAKMSAKLFISAFNFLNYSTTRITTCSWYHVIVHLLMAEVCTTNLKVTAWLKALLCQFTVPDKVKEMRII